MVTNYGGTGDLMCSSTDVKPTDVAVNTRCLELDTGKFWYFNGTSWTETPGGGGGGSATLIEKSITANGTYTASDDAADGYSSVEVDVPNTYTVDDNGKVVSNQTLVAQTAKPDTITVNDTYNTTEYNSVTVNVPNSYTAADEGKVVSGGDLVAQTSTTASVNGTIDTTLNNSVVVAVPNTYTVQDNGKVVVDQALVSQSAYPSTVTENGTIDTTNYNSVTIDVSGGGLIEKDVNFYDYDGTLLYAYTFAEANDLTELPANPTHNNGLVAQGWNWSLNGVKNCATANCKVDVGQMYTTDDGSLHYIVYTGESVFMQFYCRNATFSVDWGDGTTPYSTSEATSASYGLDVTHHYGTSGKFTIKVNMTVGLVIPRLGRCQVLEMHYGSTSWWCYMQYPSLTAVAMPNKSVAYLSGAPGGSQSLGNDNVKFLCFASAATISLGSVSNYTSVVERISIGENTNMYGYDSSFGAFRYWTRLKYLHGVVHPIQALCAYCDNLQEVSLYPTVNNVIGEDSFCYTRLHTVKLPATTTRINANAFAYCYNLTEIKFEPTTPPTVVNVNAFIDLPTTCTIYVPTGSLSAYTSASNYPDPNTYTYVEY